MPRGGKQVSDGFSPFKSAGGQELRLLKSSRSQTGYFRIVKLGNLYYPKLKLDNVKGSKSQKVFGNGHKSAREAAIFLAEYLAEPYQLASAPPRQPRGSRLTEQQQRDRKNKKLDALRAEACSLLGISEEMSAEERADSHAREREFRAWREEKNQGMPSLVLVAELGDHGDIHVSV